MACKGASELCGQSSMHNTLDNLHISVIVSNVPPSGGLS